MSRRPEKREKEKKQIKYFDYTLLFIIIFLVGFGLVMLYSTSSYNAQVKFGNSAFYLRKQLLASLIGFGGMFIVAHVDYHIWTRLSGLAYIAALGLCTLVIFAGVEYNGSSRWLRVGGISFQPSELAKFAVIIFLATIISKIPKQIGSLMTVFKILAIVLPIVVVVAVNNLSTAIIILGIAVCLLFVASPKYGQFLAMGGLVIGVGAVFIMVESYRAERLRIWLHPEDYEKGYQTLQGLYAIGSGGLFGKGLGESMQKLGFLPEAQNDMIFSIVCEELGILGGIILLLLFAYLLYRLFFIAQNAPDMFGSLMVSGIFIHIALQVIFNIAVVLNLMPNTGVTLPLVSYGGTSIVFLMSEMGLALSVARQIKFKEPERLL